MEEILNIHAPVELDESIAHCETRAHQPYGSTTFNNNDEIRILIQHQDMCVLPSRSSLHVFGKITKPDGTALANTKLVNNAICFLFEDMRYELNAIEIDRCKNVGITTLLKGWASYNPGQSNVLENAGWVQNEDYERVLTHNGHFDVNIPLNMLFGFAEDYKKVIINGKYELILTRSRDDLNAIVQESDTENRFEEFKLTLIRIEWLMPYVIPSDRYKIRLLDSIAKDKPIAMSYRSWDLYEYPSVPATMKHIWTVKTSNQLEKPRFVILALQTNRKNQKNKNNSYFDHCSITNFKLFLNSQYYPYNNLNINIDKNEFSLLYNMYTNFQKTYYDKDSEPLLIKKDFIDYTPIMVIDCSKQNELLKNTPVDIRVEFETSQNIANNTSAYCLILHDRIIEYKPMSGDVKKLV